MNARWIPVAYRLPPAEPADGTTAYAVTMVRAGVRYTAAACYKKYGRGHARWMHSGDAGLPCEEYGARVTHWQELPSPAED